MLQSIVIKSLFSTNTRIFVGSAHGYTKALSSILSKKYYSQMNLNKNISKNDKKTIEDKDLSAIKFKVPVSSQLPGTYQADYERITKYTLIPLTLIPFYASFTGITLHPLLDGSLATLILTYFHYGFNSLILDFIPREKFPKANRMSLWSLYSATALSLCGIYEIETENNGLTDILERLWNYDESNLYIFGRN
ncbi:hypothetical protein KAFR_0D01450 [Kazachstania africana CBS 2517]|uniref:Succinate dehydrogenase [ubiquinone] cytochrome b small subunit n=1 Tax=Kazachstania africana (strain ATCC 22294 / BCRC 22015 / CBS 2517 / CECT 1963 / NBRC 1671 / NRRL Y-8276) TaxID=1071382 RepID=H2ATU1_KAZAF|nr:hypothetical protein KAFR_0D01450 [Kazachstania africana CBS 2517]CCF57791.1 hypothetical protein KAFR_0D01450 [Kazachstania africana CBS 2517]